MDRWRKGHLDMVCLRYDQSHHLQRKLVDFRVTIRHHYLLNHQLSLWLAEYTSLTDQALIWINCHLLLWQLSQQSSKNSSFQINLMGRIDHFLAQLFFYENDFRGFGLDFLLSNRLMKLEFSARSLQIVQYFRSNTVWERLTNINLHFSH